MSKMNYISVEQASKNWQISDRSVRNYCAQGRVVGALLIENLENSINRRKARA